MHVGFVTAAEMLPVPKPSCLTAMQVDGTVCVWCPRPAAVDLGSRLSTGTAGLQRWRPGACRLCAGLEARRVFSIHSKTCVHCVHGDYCPDGRALHELAADSRSRPAHQSSK